MSLSLTTTGQEQRERAGSQQATTEGCYRAKEGKIGAGIGQSGVTKRARLHEVTISVVLAPQGNRTTGIVKTGQRGVLDVRS